MRVFATHIAELAVLLAQQAGEGAKRPLSEAQLQRALDVNRDEVNLISGLMWARWRAAHAEGSLPAEAYPREDV